MKNDTDELDGKVQNKNLVNHPALVAVKKLDPYLSTVPLVLDQIASAIAPTIKALDQARGPVFAAARAANRLLELSAPILEIAAEFAHQHLLANKLDEVGWLPHYTMPIEKLDYKFSADELNAVCVDHYSNEWTSVEQAFLSRIRSYSVDEEAKKAFEEALKCHQLGMFRVSPRLLFPEIERLACQLLYNGQRRITLQQENGNNRKPSITSLPMLSEWVGNLPIGDQLIADFGLSLLIKLETHFYRNVRDDETLLEVARDPVPNRHAVVHGIVSYNSMQSSINALIIADYLYCTIAHLAELSVSGEIEFRR